MSYHKDGYDILQEDINNINMYINQTRGLIDKVTTSLVGISIGSDEYNNMINLRSGYFIQIREKEAKLKRLAVYLSKSDSVVYEHLMNNKSMSLHNTAMK